MMSYEVVYGNGFKVITEIITADSFEDLLSKFEAVANRDTKPGAMWWDTGDIESIKVVM